MSTSFDPRISASQVHPCRAVLHVLHSAATVLRGRRVDQDTSTVFGGLSPLFLGVTGRFTQFSDDRCTIHLRFLFAGVNTLVLQRCTQNTSQAKHQFAKLSELPSLRWIQTNTYKNKQININFAGRFNFSICFYCLLANEDQRLCLRALQWNCSLDVGSKEKKQINMSLAKRLHFAELICVELTNKQGVSQIRCFLNFLLRDNLKNLFFITPAKSGKERQPCRTFH